MNTDQLFKNYLKQDPDNAFRLWLDNMWDEIAMNEIGINEYTRVLIQKEKEN